MSDPVSLTELFPGESAEVVAFKGRLGMVHRLNSMGIFKGKTVTRANSRCIHGTVVIKVDSVDIAIGCGMASKILVVRRSE